MNIPILILRTHKILVLKILKFFDADPDYGTGCCQLWIWIRFWGSKYLDSLMQIRILGRDLGNPESGMVQVGSGINIPDPQQMLKTVFLNKALQSTYLNLGGAVYKLVAPELECGVL